MMVAMFIGGAHYMHGQFNLLENDYTQSAQHQFDSLRTAAGITDPFVRNTAKSHGVSLVFSKMMFHPKSTQDIIHAQARTVGTMYWELKRIEIGRNKNRQNEIRTLSANYESAQKQNRLLQIQLGQCSKSYTETRNMLELVAVMQSGMIHTPIRDICFETETLEDMLAAYEAAHSPH